MIEARATVYSILAVSSVEPVRASTSAYAVGSSFRVYLVIPPQSRDTIGAQRAVDIIAAVGTSAGSTRLTILVSCLCYSAKQHEGY